jgi:SAM-dependent methyltransferase
LTFGEVAADFDRVRLGYPDALVDDVLAYGGLPATGRRALEVGAGTGKATLAFAARGVPVVAVEPDAAMAGVLARHVAGRPVRIVASTFEEYRPEEEFGLLFSADSWHWTDPGRRWPLAARVLAAGATLALFWNFEHLDEADRRESMMDIFATLAPTVVVEPPPAPADLLTVWPGDELAAVGDFTDLAARAYPSRVTFAGSDYLTHLSTRSQIRMLDEPVRRRLLADLAGVFADPVPVTVHTVLYLARRRPRAA